MVNERARVPVSWSFEAVVLDKFESVLGSGCVCEWNGDGVWVETPRWVMVWDGMGGWCGMSWLADQKAST